MSETEDFGRLIDRLDNLAHALNMPMSDAMHVKCLRLALPELVRQFKAEFVASSGENPWEGHPE